MKKTAKSFKYAFTELEKLTQELEDSSPIELEKGVQLFEQGIELAQICKDYLSIMENKIINIKSKYSKTDDKQ